MKRQKLEQEIKRLQKELETADSWDLLIEDVKKACSNAMCEVTRVRPLVLDVFDEGQYKKYGKLFGYVVTRGKEDFFWYADSLTNTHWPDVDHKKHEDDIICFKTPIMWFYYQYHISDFKKIEGGYGTERNEEWTVYQHLTRGIKVENPRHLTTDDMLQGAKKKFEYDETHL